MRKRRFGERRQKKTYKRLKDRGKINNHLAVMLDTFFENLAITEDGYKYAEKDYPLSWYKADNKSEN